MERCLIVLCIMTVEYLSRHYLIKIINTSKEYDDICKK